MHWIIEAQFLVALSLAGVSQSSGNQDASPIKLIGTGVAKTYSASKDISCDEYSWRVKWASAQNPNKITGEVIVMINQKGIMLSDSANEVFARLSHVNNVTATCNPATDKSPTSSTLLVSGTDASTGTTALAQLNVADNLEFNWSYDVD